MSKWEGNYRLGVYRDGELSKISWRGHVGVAAVVAWRLPRGSPPAHRPRAGQTSETGISSNSAPSTLMYPLFLHGAPPSSRVLGSTQHRGGRTCDMC